ncbi:uncharacterized protein MONBRDRAFT_27150 [Monosiga brevicollis MX1]|uniref:Uncharacterized protein n=1 Tax=Monosiga brevicollis TaxID=81824 RepID=A9V4G3_MONBE|nr:uncharacterized protein MONBRDRAFT_27150 [Monosiga brevicollis MX1]EDQ87610.1 predicted protein [Monosiga brevicollis MX1]|eukprot:XP_001747530.1 hypothetical protein [Monosiga brevicollis MX1]
MGCGSSTAVVVRDTLPAPDARKTNKKRRRNMKAPHGHLLNTLDETIETAKAWREYATQRRQHFADWHAWLGDETENPNEHRLRKACQARIAEAEDQSAHDVDMLSHYNAQVANLQEVLKVLKEHDRLVTDLRTAQQRLHDAREHHQAAVRNHEKAKLKANYQTLKPKIEHDLMDLHAQVGACERQVEAAERTVEKSVVSTRERKQMLVAKSLLYTHASMIDYHQRSIETLRKYNEQIHILCQPEKGSFARTSVTAPAIAPFVPDQSEDSQGPPLSLPPATQQSIAALEAPPAMAPSTLNTTASPALPSSTPVAVTSASGTPQAASSSPAISSPESAPLALQGPATTPAAAETSSPPVREEVQANTTTTLAIVPSTDRPDHEARERRILPPIQRPLQDAADELE